MLLNNVHQTDFPAEAPPFENPIVYLVSSKSGFGHVSRAMAVVHELPPDVPVLLAAHENSHNFIQGNLPLGDHKCSIQLLDHAYEMDGQEFVKRNAELLETASMSPTIINDFLTQIPEVRSVLDEQGASPPLVGIYHSIDGYQTDIAEVKKYQEQYKKIAGYLDFLFLTEPRPEHAKPYELDSGTVVIPCDPVVRRPSLDASKVKETLGLDPDDEFIYVQGGMQGGKELNEFVTSLSQISLEGIKVVLAPFKSLQDPLVISAENIVQMGYRFDAQNVVAASLGVISQPGMGITCEAIASRKPLLLLDSPDLEKKLKHTMLKDILGDELPFCLDMDRPLSDQIGEWLAASEEIAERFSKIPCNGAAEIVRTLPLLC